MIQLCKQDKEPSCRISHAEKIHAVMRIAFLLFSLTLLCGPVCTAKAARPADETAWQADGKTAVSYGTQVQADIDGDGRADRVSIRDIRDSGDVFTQITAWIDGLAYAQRDYEGYYSSFLAAGDLTGDGKADILVARYDTKGYGELELSVLHLADGKWETHPGRFIHNGDISIHQPFDFTDSWHDTYIGAAIVEKDGRTLLRFILLPDAADTETVTCIDASYYADGWLVEDARVIENYHAGGYDKSLLEGASDCLERAVCQAAQDTSGHGQEARPKKNTSDEDEAAVMKIIEQQASAGVSLSTNLADESVYTWTISGNERRLTGIDWDADENDQKLKGRVSFAGLPKLISLSCQDGQLTEIDLSGNTELAYLNCGCNQLTDIDVSRNPMLQTLYCYDNQLTELNVGNNPELHILNCSGNRLTDMDVSKNTKLSELRCNHNLLRKLDIRQQPGLEFLDCGGNQLAALDVSCNKNLETLWCSGNKLTALRLVHQKNLGSLECSSNQLAGLNTSCSTKLYHLDCSNNVLASLDVSRNPKLGSLDCSGNRLKELDVSRNKKLGFLRCSSNQLKKLDVSRNSRMEELDCRQNLLSSLDVGSNAILHSLDCSKNRLGTLKMGCKKGYMIKLNCKKNNLKSLDLSSTQLWDECDFQYDSTMKVTGLYKQTYKITA